MQAHTMGIRGQLTWLVLGIVALALGLATAFEVNRERRDALYDYQTRNQKVLEAVGVTVAMHVAQNDLSSLDTLVAHLSESMRGRDLLELTVLDETGRVLAHTDPERFNQRPDDAFSKQAVEMEGPISVIRDRQLFQSAPAISGIRWGTVTARFSLDRLDAQFLRTRNRLALGALLIFSVVGTLLFLGLDRLVVRPVRTLSQSVRRMGEGHLTSRVPELAGKELGELARTINGMASALQHERENLERAVTERTRELQEVNARLERLAVTDGLTGVFNHRRFQEQLSAELARADRHKRALSLLMVDVDYFKKVNDALGHPAGDELLRKLAEVLSADLRQTDFIARYGGEEFVVLLPETSKTEAMQVAERMRQAVETRLNAEPRWPQRVTVSIGVATYGEDGSANEALLTSADQAMYVAKRQGRNRVIGARGLAA